MKKGGLATAVLFQGEGKYKRALGWYSTYLQGLDDGLTAKRVRVRRQTWRLGGIILEALLGGIILGLSQGE